MPDPLPRPTSTLSGLPEADSGLWDHVDFPAGRDPLTFLVPPNILGTVAGGGIFGIQTARLVLEIREYLAAGTQAGAGPLLTQLQPFIITGLIGLIIFIWSSYWSRVRFDPHTSTVTKRDIFFWIPVRTRKWSFFDMRRIDFNILGSGNLPAAGPFELSIEGIHYFRRAGCLALPMALFRFIPLGPGSYKLHLVLRDRRRVLIHSTMSRRKAAERAAVAARMTRTFVG